MKTNLLLILSYIISVFNLLNAQSDNTRFKYSISNPNKKNSIVDSIKVFNPTLLTTPATNYSTLNSIVVADSTDIRVFPSANSQSEVHISISRHNPANLIISANTYTTTYQQGFYVSNNSGKTWTGSDALQNSINVLGDPSTAYDNNGNVYLSTITNLDDGYFLQRSVNNGNTWSNLIRGVTVNNFDKEMIAIDDNPGSPYVNNIYCTWSEFNTPITVNFNKSTDSGQNFSIPITIKTGYGQGANVQTGVNGEVYVCWADFGTGNFPANGIGFTVSNDGGNTFSNAKVAFPYLGISSTKNGDPTFNNIRVNPTFHCLAGTHC